MRKIFIITIVLILSCIFSQSEIQVEKLQETVLKIYPELLASTVRVEVGSSGASAVSRKRLIRQIICRWNSSNN